MRGIHGIFSSTTFSIASFDVDVFPPNLIFSDKFISLSYIFCSFQYISLDDYGKNDHLISLGKNKWGDV